MDQRKELSISVAEPVANVLEEAAKLAGITVGEMVDRLALQEAPYDPHTAYESILARIFVGMGGLDRKDIARTFGKVGAIFLLAAPPMELDIIVAAMKKQRAEGSGVYPNPLTDEERFYYIQSFRDTIFPKEKGTYRPEK